MASRSGISNASSPACPRARSNSRHAAVEFGIAAAQAKSPPVRSPSFQMVRSSGTMRVTARGWRDHYLLHRRDANSGRPQDDDEQHRKEEQDHRHGQFG